MDQDGPKPDVVDVNPPIPAEEEPDVIQPDGEDEYQRSLEIRQLSDAALVGSLLDQLDEALDTYQADMEMRKGLDDEQRAIEVERLETIRAAMSVEPSFLRGARIRISHKVEKKQDEARLDQGEDIGVNVEIDLPKLRKLLVLNIWGSKLDYESSTQFDPGSHKRAALVMDRPRTINFHMYRKYSTGNHGYADNERLEHNAKYVFHRTGHPGNHTEIMMFDGQPYRNHESRPQHVTPSQVSRTMNGDLFALTDELYNRRGVEEPTPSLG
jgi:hypothetical protein